MSALPNVDHVAHGGPPLQAPLDLLLKGATVVTLDEGRRILLDGAVGIRGERIAYVGSAVEAPTHASTRTIDCSAKVVLPGFVNTHDHMYQQLARGFAERLEPGDLYDWLARFILPVVDASTVETTRAGALLGAMQAASCGVTTTFDNHYGFDSIDALTAVVEGMSGVGIRGIVGRGIWGPETELSRASGVHSRMFKYSVAEEIALTEECMIRHPWGSLVSVVPYPDRRVGSPGAQTWDAMAGARPRGRR